MKKDNSIQVENFSEVLLFRTERTLEYNYWQGWKQKTVCCLLLIDNNIQDNLYSLNFHNQFLKNLNLIVNIFNIS